MQELIQMMLKQRLVGIQSGTQFWDFFALTI